MAQRRVQSQSHAKGTDATSTKQDNSSAVAGNAVARSWVTGFLVWAEVPQVAVQQAKQVMPVLQRQRVVQAHLLAVLRDDHGVGGRLVAEDRREGVGGDQVGQDERDHRDAPYQQHADAEPGRDIA